MTEFQKNNNTGKEKAGIWEDSAASDDDKKNIKTLTRGQGDLFSKFLIAALKERVEQLECAAQKGW